MRSVLSSQDIQRYWQDETIAAVLQGDNPDEFLRLLKGQLFLDNGELLKRFCFILRIACQMPEQTITSESKGNNERALLDALFLKPYGQGWKAIICFLLENKELLSKALVPHVTAVLNDWSSAIHLVEALPVLSRDAGLLALYLLDDLKESYTDDGDRKKLLSIIIKTIPEINEEFVELLETDVFVSKHERQRPRYVKDFCKMAFLGVESAFFCKHAPDKLIKLAYSEWLIEESGEDDEEWHRSSIGVAEYFGLYEYKYKFSPASGAKGPFQYLLRFHPRKGLDFILQLLNITAKKYAHSDLDSPQRHSYMHRKLSEPVIEPLTIQLNDGTKVQQYYSGRLWGAYRGHSVVPDLLQSALMALENWLIAYTEYLESDKLEWLFNHVLQNSNSVMPTAVLASVATGFPEKVGKFALPLLRTPDLYFMDSSRTIHERAGNEINWFSGEDAFSKIYTEERRIAALRSWRREHLERLVVRLQFSEWRDEALAAIDVLRASAPNDEMMRFLFHRIDSRGWRAVEDKENNRFILESKGLEPDLEEIQQKAQEEMQVTNRFSTLFVWVRKIFEYELSENDYYTTWSEALAEAKELFEALKAGAVSNLAAMYSGSIVMAAAVFVRDHSNELDEEDIVWCTELITQAVVANADIDNSVAIADATDLDGAAAAASVLPILLDFALEENEKFIVKRLIAIALTHINEKIYYTAAEGIRHGCVAKSC